MIRGAGFIPSPHHPLLGPPWARLGGGTLFTGIAGGLEYGSRHPGIRRGCKEAQDADLSTTETKQKQKQRTKQDTIEGGSTAKIGKWVHVSPAGIRYVYARSLFPTSVYGGHDPNPIGSPSDKQSFGSPGYIYIYIIRSANILSAVLLTLMTIDEDEMHTRRYTDYKREIRNLNADHLAMLP